jgi:23S rRNA (uracil1939-C5)-methyltransferase
MKNRNDNNSLIATVYALSHEGRGIAKIADKTMFIEGALPGETVKFEVQRRKRRFDEATVTEILESSKDRVVPPCPHFTLCGGCSLQHMHPEAQVFYKQNIVLEQLRHFGGVEPQKLLPPILGPTIGYRRRARLGVKFVTKKGKMLVGFREKNSGLLADLDRCEILAPSVGRLFLELKQLIFGLQAYRAIPQIEVAVGDTQTALVFRHLEPLNEQDKQSLVAFGVTHGIYIYLQPHGPDSVYRIWPTGKETSETLSYHLPEFDINISFQPTDFTQVNSHVNRQMVSKVIEFLKLQPTDKVLDLFCGLGNFTLPMAKRAAKVVGVEGSESAIKQARENAKCQGITNTEFYVENLQNNAFQEHLSISKKANAKPGPEHLINVDAWAFQPYDKILLDPPRTGAIEVIPLIANLQATRIVYVSCNPATLARDLGVLVKNHGFQLESLSILDMFPHTTHVESIAVLHKAKNLKG